MYLLRILFALSFLIIAIGLLISLCVNGFSAIQLGLSLLSWGMAYICWPHQQRHNRQQHDSSYPDWSNIVDAVELCVDLIEVIAVGLFHVLRMIGHFLLHLIH